MPDLPPYHHRSAILVLLFTVPFLRMLAEHRYGFLYIEVLAAVLIIAGVAAALAALARTPNTFRVVVAGSVVLLSVNALQVNLLPDVRTRWILLGILAVLVAGLLLLKTHFYRILVIFIVGSCLGDVTNAIAGFAGTRPSQQDEQGRHEHVVHIILDEIVGLGAVPPDCHECVNAADALQTTLTRGNFQIYPYAFSNYQGTRDSIPSILNGRLLARTEEYLKDGGDYAFPYLQDNRYFESFLAKNYAIRTYQSDFLLFDAPTYPSIQSRTYKANSLNALHALEGSWLARLNQLFAIYVQSDRFWWGLSSRLLPSGLQFERIDIGPLAAAELWPATILEDYRGAKQNTLFLIHLLTPHHPYVYRADGSTRTLQELKSQRNFWVYDVDEYRKLYSMHGEQLHHLAAQLDRFLEGLKQTDSYDSTTVIIHGDHGSRIRLLTPDHNEEHARLRSQTTRFNPLSRYDYLGEPDLNDLLNRFATLLAIKLPATQSAEVVTETGSVLYFLQQHFGAWSGSNDPERLNSVYLFDKDGLPKGIPLADRWRADQTRSGGRLHQSLED